MQEARRAGARMRPRPRVRPQRGALGRRQAGVRVLLGQRVRRARRERPGRPTMKGHTVYPANADGDAHSSNYDEERRLPVQRRRGLLQGLGSGTEKGFGTCACGTTRTWRRHGRSAASRRRTRAGARTSTRATTRSTTRCWSETRSTSPGTRTASGRRRERPAAATRGRVLRPARGQQPDQAVAAGTPTQRDTGLGRRLRREPRPGLRQRHELGALDPATNRLKTTHRWENPRAGLGQRSTL